MEYQLTKNKNPEVAIQLRRVDKQMKKLLRQKPARQRYMPPMPTFPTVETIGNFKINQV